MLETGKGGGPHKGTMGLRNWWEKKTEKHIVERSMTDNREKKGQ